ncbi:MAG TPA: hypothetical protein VKZ82_28500 [Nonomuraea sp.]|nr:hypothetical protein [Nonomuraea sp.]
MALEMDSWAVTGAQSSARIARLQHQSGTASGNGVVDADHLRVLPLAVPGTGVRITSGGATILGREQQFQGSYFAYNVGEETVPISPTGSGGGRTDMIVLRVEDPNIDGTSWSHDVTSDPVYYFRVIEGVSSTATQPPAGMTAIPLARITLPASTGTVTAGMITDLRRSAVPKSERVLRVQRGGTIENGEWDEAGNIVAPDYERFPQHEWSVTVPSWATQVQVLGSWQNMLLAANGGTSGAHDARGQAFVGFAGGPVFLQTTPSAYNMNQTSPTNGYRCGFVNYDQIAIPASLRGLTLQLRMYVSGTAGYRGRLVADNWANFAVDLQFLEIPAPAAQL